jgi:diacylglycerol kinase (ATP)
MSALPPEPDASRGRFVRSFGFAGRGIVMLLRTQQNARIHAVATVLVLAGGWALGISRLEWCAVIGMSGLVWMAEGMNTAIEAAVDLVSPEQHPLAGRAKDVAAGAVLCAAIAAAFVGALIFGPRLWALTAR